MCTREHVRVVSAQSLGANPQQEAAMSEHQPTAKELECWRELERLVHQAHLSKSSRHSFIELDADPVKQLLLELDWERYVR